MPDDRQEETHQGFLMDISCIRKSPADELLERASEHSTACALMGHCIESGFALVDDEGRVQMIEPAATTAVVRHLLDTDVQAGLRLLLRRERRGEEMHTIDVARCPATFGAIGHHVEP